MKGGHNLKYFLTLVIMQNKKNVKHCMHSFLSINLKKTFSFLWKGRAAVESMPK